MSIFHFLFSHRTRTLSVCILQKCQLFIENSDQNNSLTCVYEMENIFQKFSRFRLRVMELINIKARAVWFTVCGLWCFHFVRLKLWQGSRLWGFYMSSLVDMCNQGDELKQQKKGQTVISEACNFELLSPLILVDFSRYSRAFCVFERWAREAECMSRSCSQGFTCYANPWHA